MNIISKMFLDGRHGKSMSLVSHLNPKTILDVGCDDGRFLVRLCKQFPSAQLFGCDIDQKSIHSASIACLNSHLYCGDFFNSKFKKMDLITLLEVLEHQTDPAVMLSKAKSLLKKNGRILVSIPKSELWYWQVIWILWSHTFGRRWLDQHKNLTQSQLVNIALKCGLELESKSSFFFGCISIMLFAPVIK
ncbi:MAG: class I SAM-dependent methyltransferase [Candidatus Micrarchaeota archaeon]